MSLDQMLRRGCWCAGGLLGALQCSAVIAASTETDPGLSTVALWAAPNWQPEAASKAAQVGGSSGLALSLEHTRDQAPQSLLSALQALTARTDLSWPVKEAAIDTFVSGLYTLRRDQLPPSALAFLKSWQGHTLVAHAEHGEFGTPLYSIAARTQGAENRWRHDAAQASSAAALTRGSADFIEAWRASTDPASQAGTLDALDHADVGSLRALLAVIAQTTERAELRSIRLRAARALGDRGVLQALLLEAGAELKPLLLALADALPTADTIALAEALISTAPASTSALAIALWSPHWLGNGRAERLLFDLLGNPQLGASAALALARIASPGARWRLQAITAQPGRAANKQAAQLALRLSELESAR